MYRQRIRSCAGAIVLALATLLAVGTPAMAEDTATSFAPEFVAQLHTNKEIYVATLRKSGSRSKAVPVWFAYVDDAIWFTTGPDSYKARRIKRGSPMLVSVHGKDGPFVKTTATIVNDPAMAERLGKIYSSKYWIAWLGFFRPSRARVESGKVILLRLTPAS